MLFLRRAALSSKMCVWLCMSVLFYVCVGIDFVELSQERVYVYIWEVLKNAFAYVWETLNVLRQPCWVDRTLKLNCKLRYRTTVLPFFSLWRPLLWGWLLPDVRLLQEQQHMRQGVRQLPLRLLWWLQRERLPHWWVSFTSHEVYWPWVGGNNGFLFYLSFCFRHCDIMCLLYLCWREWVLFLFLFFKFYFSDNCFVMVVKLTVHEPMAVVVFSFKWMFVSGIVIKCVYCLYLGWREWAFYFCWF